MDSQAAKRRDMFEPSVLVGTADQARSRKERFEERFSWRKAFTPFNLLFALFALLYAAAFWNHLSRWWFNPLITTDDALQQSFIFHAVTHPHIFAGDLIYNAMKGYLAPLHYWINYAITLLTQDPVMTGHWVMLLQLVPCVLFIFLGVRAASAAIPAYLGVMWLLHTRNVVQRLTGGLPRGWAAPLLAAYLCFALRGNHKLVLLTLLIGCLTHPPATALAALSYGLLLLWRVACKETRESHVKPLLVYLALSPLYLALTFYVIHRPPEIGQMVSYEVAESMPAFDRPGGRFPFLPFREPLDEITAFSFQAFLMRFYNPGALVKQSIPWLVVAIFAGLLLGGWWRRRSAIPDTLLVYLASIFVLYFASRELAFKLYVPNRHLQFPMAMFFIFAFPIGIWRLFVRSDPQHVEAAPSSWRRCWPAVVPLVLLCSLVYLGSGTGLYGASNFNKPANAKGHIWNWFRKYTPEDSLVAGHPTHIDDVQLFAMRRGFVTSETSHPFYDVYFEEMTRRLEISLRAHYARDLSEVVQLLEPEGIDYFVFRRKDFYPEELAEASFFKPLDQLVHELTRRHYTEYAYRALPREVDLERFPYMPFRDRLSVVVDIAKLKAHLAHEEQI